jgi:hypothetical protein
MMADGKAIMRDYGNVRDHYANFLTRWDLQAPFIDPSRIGILGGTTPGQNQLRDVYDSTTMGANDLLSKFISSSTFSPGQRWGRITAKRFSIGERDDIDDWCDEVTEKMLKAIGASNFYAEAPDMTKDYTGFGTGSLHFDERKEYASEYESRRGGFRGLRFQATKTGRFFNATDAEGKIDKEYREQEMSVRAARAKFGDAALPADVKSYFRAGADQEKKFTFIHAAYPRPKSEYKGRGTLSYPYASCWVEKESKELVRESGYKFYPFANPRWEVTPGEIPGRGPGDRAFPDTRSLNEAKKLDLEALAIDVRKPLIQASDSVLGDIELRPAGRSIVKTGSQRSVKDVLQALETSPNYQMANVKEEQLRQSINELFFVDILRALLKVEKSEMTAFEFARKLELMYRILGAVYGRYESDFLAPLWDGVFTLMWDASALPPPPPELFDEVKEIQIEFTSPLALAQKAQEVDGVLKTFSAIPVLGQNDPQAITDLKDNFDQDKAMRFIAKTYGLPESVIVSEQVRDEKRQARTQARQEVNQMAQIQAGSEAARNVAPLITSLQNVGVAGNA